MNRKRAALAAAIIVCFVVTMLIGQTAFAMGNGSPTLTNKCGSNQSTISAPKGLKLVSKTDTTAAIKWSAPGNKRGIKGYTVYRDGKLVGTTAGTTFADKDLTPNTYYSWTVKAYDSCKRLSAASNKLTTATPIIIREDVTWSVDTAPATINGGLIVEESAHLQIDPGVILMIKPCQSVTVYGAINAGGTADAPVVFTASGDKAYGGSGVGSSGYWGTLKVAPGAIFTGDSIKLTYAGTLATVQGMLILNNSEIAYAKTQGIYVDTAGEFDGVGNKIHDCCEVSACKGIDVKGQVNLTASEIYDCPGTGVLVEATGTFNATSVNIRNCGKGVEVRGNINMVLCSISASHYGLYFNTTSFNGVILNSFLGNDQYGIYNSKPDDVTIDASMNYWGSPNGPSVFDDTTKTWSDGGDRVSKGVKYDNWLTEKAQ